VRALPFVLEAFCCWRARLCGVDAMPRAIRRAAAACGEVARLWGKKMADVVRNTEKFGNFVVGYFGDGGLCTYGM